MKFLVIFALAVTCARAGVSPADAGATILKFDSDVQPEGFQYVYETSNGIYATSNGVVKNPNSDNAVLEVSGEFRYTGDDGATYSVNYVANEDGFQPQGDHLPVAPPVPELIQRSLEYNAAHPQPEEKYVASARVSPPAVPAYKPSVQTFNKPTKPYRRF